MNKNSSFFFFKYYVFVKVIVNHQLHQSYKIQTKLINLYIKFQYCKIDSKHFLFILMLLPNSDPPNK